MRQCRALLSLWLVLAASGARAADLYRWIDPDGREAIGTVPPPGVEAVPWKPGQAEAPASPAAPAPAQPQPPITPARAAAARAAAEREQRCRQQLERENETRAAIRKQEAEVEALQAKLAKLEASEVAYSRTDCVDAYTRSGVECTSEVFDRDKEIARMEGSLARAREKLDDLELAPAVAPEPGCE